MPGDSAARRAAADARRLAGPTTKESKVSEESSSAMACGVEIGLDLARSSVSDTPYSRTVLSTKTRWYKTPFPPRCVPTSRALSRVSPTRSPPEETESSVAAGPVDGLLQWTGKPSLQAERLPGEGVDQLKR